MLKFEPNHSYRFSKIGSRDWEKNGISDGMPSVISVNIEDTSVIKVASHSQNSHFCRIR